MDIGPSQIDAEKHQTLFSINANLQRCIKHQYRKNTFSDAFKSGCLSRRRGLTPWHPSAWWLGGLPPSPQTTASHSDTHHPPTNDCGAHNTPIYRYRRAEARRGVRSALALLGRLQIELEEEEESAPCHLHWSGLRRRGRTLGRPPQSACATPFAQSPSCFKNSEVRSGSETKPDFSLPAPATSWRVFSPFSIRPKRHVPGAENPNCATPTAHERLRMTFFSCKNHPHG